MRLVVDCAREAAIGSKGELQVELSRTGMSTLSDRRAIEVVKTPPADRREQKIVMPPFDVRRVEGPDDDLWLRVRMCQTV